MTSRHALSASALSMIAGLASAQPAAFTDLGDRSSTQTFSQVVTLTSPSNIQWFKLQLPGVTASAGWVDIWTVPVNNPFTAADLLDTEIGLYNASGGRAVPTPNFSDDNDGPGSFSQLSFGSTVARPAISFGTFTTGNPRAGVDGVINAGVYYLAVGGFDCTFATTGFGVTSNYAGARTTTLLNFDIRNPTQPYPPTAIGNASPSTANAGDTVVYTVTVIPGGNPTSSGVVVSGALTAIGGGNAIFHDDGLNGDAAAGDSIYSYRYTLPDDLTDASYAIPVSVIDGQSRTAEATINGVVTGEVTWDEWLDGGGDAGQTLETAQGVTGNGADIHVITGHLDTDDVDIYRISICNPLDFIATTRFSAPVLDTQLYIFNSTGHGVVMNDEVPEGFAGSDTHASTIDGQFLTESDNFYIAVTGYNVDPQGPSGSIWADTPSDAIRVPDGTNPTGVLTSWAGTSTEGDYRLSLTGACFPVRECGGADIGRTGGSPGADGHLDNNDFVVFIDYFFGQRILADVGSTGGVAGSDAHFDNNDFVVFIDMFFSGSGDCH